MSQKINKLSVAIDYERMVAWPGVAKTVETRNITEYMLFG